MKKVDNLSKYDCELVDTNNLEHQTSAYYNAENYQAFVSDDDMPIPKGFDPYCAPVNLPEEYSEENGLVLVKKNDSI